MKFAVSQLLVLRGDYWIVRSVLKKKRRLDLERKKAGLCMRRNTESWSELLDSFVPCRVVSGTDRSPVLGSGRTPVLPTGTDGNSGVVLE
jgi:hypothetical protein